MSAYRASAVSTAKTLLDEARKKTPVAKKWSDESEPGRLALALCTAAYELGAAHAERVHAKSAYEDD